MDSKMVAQYMLAELEKEGILFQDVVYDIEKKFGNEFVGESEYGNLIISKKVLNEFSKIKGENTKYDRTDKCWRK